MISSQQGLVTQEGFLWGGLSEGHVRFLVGGTMSPRASSAHEAIRLGLLLFAKPGEMFETRCGGRRGFLTDIRGAGANLPLRELIVGRLLSGLSSLPEHDALAGVVRAGTTWACWLAWEKGLPLANILVNGPRETGLKRDVEGDISGQRVILVDNWIKSGASVKTAAEAVRRAGGTVVGVLTIVKEGDPQVGVPIHSAWDLEELLGAARELGHGEEP